MKKIKDRLAEYYHWDDEQNLEQALWVANENEFDMEAIEEWSRVEGALEKFWCFRDRVGE